MPSMSLSKYVVVGVLIPDTVCILRARQFGIVLCRFLKCREVVGVLIPDTACRVTSLFEIFNLFQMEVFDTEKVRFTEKQMLLDFGNGSLDAMKRDAAATADIWKSTKECDHGRNLSSIGDQLSGKAARMDDFGRLKNESLRWGGNILMAGKVGAGRWAIVVGAGGVFCARSGCDKVVTAKLACLDWTAKIAAKIRDVGGPEVFREWKEEVVGDLMRRWEGEGFTVSVPEYRLPVEAVARLDALTRGDQIMAKAFWFLLLKISAK